MSELRVTDIERRAKHEEALERQAQRIARSGIVWVTALLLIFSGLVGRVLHLKLAPPPRLLDAAGHPYSSAPEFARRGDIVDRRGRVIATSEIGYRLFVDPQEVEDPFTIALDIADLIGGDPTEYDRAIFSRAESRYAVLNHLLEDWQVEVIRQTRIKGVGLTPRLVREYTNETIGGLVVGRVGFEHSGQGGMEHRFEDRLAPEDGRLTFLRDASGRPLWIDPDGLVERSNGADIQLSIDLVLQEFVERRLHDAVIEANAGGGRMIVVDVRTGEILAIADTLRQREGWDEFTADPIREKHAALGRNRNATDPYEPGSTFKPFIWSIALERDKVELDEVLETPHGPPGYRKGRRIIRDSWYYGPSTWEKVLVKSMNSGMAIVADRFSHGEMREAIDLWGFGRETGSGIPGESRGMITPLSKWSDYSQLSVSYGHEIMVTPLQMVQAFSAFARDGTMPHLRMTATRDASMVVPIVQRVIEPQTAERTRLTLRKVMLHGTGRKAQSQKYRLWGKSGTAQLPKKDGGGYHENRYVSSFIAGAPLQQPRVIVLCVMDDPDRSIEHHGGVIGGQPVRDVIDFTLEYMGVPHDVVDLVQEAKDLDLIPAEAGLD